MKTDIRIFVSAVSIGEIAIKRALNRIDFQIEPLEILKECNANGYIMLDITPELAAKVRGIPLHHRDPFDRLLIAQAQELDIPVMTTDSIFKRYDVRLVPV